MKRPFIVSRATFQETRLVSHENQYYNQIRTIDAQKMAAEAGLNLVCFKEAAGNELAFCKIIDYSKWKYIEEKKKRKQIKESKHATKEIRFTPVIEQHDIEYKVKQAIEFLKDGDDVVLAMFLKGRQKAFFKEAENKMNDIVNMCLEHGKEHSRKKTSGMIMVKMVKTNKEAA